MKIYLDNCCFNRPFDDQSKIRIKLETDAKLRIQADIMGDKFELIWSYILEAENMANPFKERKKSISDWKKHALVMITENPTILNKAKELTQMGLRSKDALRISCALSAGCQYFLTTDDKIINKNKIT
ncbi:MAG: PIN domain protein [Acidobacteria bacterium]|nr:PIN domain protein [Acidobacteriota bacterium]MBI3657129.1 PIN domain protein [Acidobacteriota bacterium]